MRSKTQTSCDLITSKSSQVFSRARRRLQALASNSDWFIALQSFVLLCLEFRLLYDGQMKTALM